MNKNNQGFVKILLLVALLLVAAGVVFLNKNEELAYQLFNKYISDNLVDKIFNFFN